MTAHTNRWLWSTGAAIVIWISLAAMAIWAPPLISGSEQEHLPLVPFIAWIWALLATGLVLMAPAVTTGSQTRLWAGYAGAVSALWIVAAVVAIAAPSFITGTDPTSIPLPGIVAPIMALVVTAYATVAAVAIGAREESLGSTIDGVVRTFSEAAHRPVG